MNRLVDWRGVEFDIELLDIQQLNDRLFEGQFDVAKTSFHAAFAVGGPKPLFCLAVQRSGLGSDRCCWQARRTTNRPTRSKLCFAPENTRPLRYFFQLFYPRTARIEHCVFSDIMPRLQSDAADFGVCIHEGRFTWQQQGLHLVEDLGTRWESETQSPLPLGGLVARRSLDDEIVARVQAVVHESLLFSLADPKAALPSMRKYAQEFDDDVLMQHVHLYVNDWTVDLAAEGRQSLTTLSQMAQSVGIGSPANELEVWSE